MAPGVPCGIGPQLDRKRLEGLTCLDCEHTGHEYEPWIGSGHYVVLAVCGGCGRLERQG